MKYLHYALFLCLGVGWSYVYGQLGSHPPSIWLASQVLFAVIITGSLVPILQTEAAPNDASPAFEALFGILTDQFYVLEANANGAFINASANYLNRMGLTLEQLQSRARGELSDPAASHHLQGMWDQVQSGKTFSGEFHDVAMDGSTVSIRAIVVPQLAEGGKIVSVWTLGFDITDKVNAERDALEASARLGAFVKHAPAAVAMFDNDMRYIGYTDRWLEDYGLPRESLIGRSHYDVFPEIPEHWKAKHQRVLAGATETNDEECFTRQNGEQTIIKWEVRPWYKPNQAIGGMMMLTEDITKQKALKDKLWVLAHIDTLTGLSNRRHFNVCLQQAIDSGSPRCLSLAIVDLDKFKEINDTLGHDVGDAVLAEVAHRLKQAVGETGVAARLGGDEFALLIVEEDDSLSVSDAVIARIIESMKSPIEAGGICRECTVSVGVTFTSGGVGPGQFLKQADLALYRAKLLGRNRVVDFSIEMQNDLQSKVTLETEASAALKNRQFALFFQPIVPVDPSIPVSFEALLRWKHPEKGILAPGRFNEVFESQKIAVELGEFVRRSAIDHIRHWQTEGLNFNRVAINVIAADFASGQFAERLLDELARAGVSPERLCVEITENVFLGSSSEHIADALEKIHRAGVEIALDDFGTGYASLSHLKRYPIDRLKIDRSFVSDMETNPNSRSIGQAIGHLGTSLGLSLTAEGVETRDQAVLLTATGCGSLQGYYYSRPMPFDEVSAWVDGKGRKQRAL